MSEGKKSKWQGSDGLTRFGAAGPPIQHSETIKITIDELKALIKENDIKPDKLFSKDEIAADPKVKARIEALVEIEAEKQKKLEKEEEDQFIPDPDEKGEPSGENDLIPD